MLVLRVLQPGALHGYAIGQRIRRLSNDVVQIEEGSLYPSMQKMLKKGWIKADWGITDTKRRARFYQLTAAGRTQLSTELTGYSQANAAIQAVLDLA